MPEHAETRRAVEENQEQVDKISGHQTERCPQLDRISLSTMNSRGLPTVISLLAFPAPPCMAVQVAPIVSVRSRQRPDVFLEAVEQASGKAPFSVIL